MLICSCSYLSGWHVFFYCFASYQREVVVLTSNIWLFAGTGTVAIILLRGHTLHILRTKGSTGQMVDLLALMDVGVGYHPPTIMDMVHWLTGGAQPDPLLKVPFFVTFMLLFCCNYILMCCFFVTQAEMNFSLRILDWEVGAEKYTLWCNCQLFYYIF